jgi:rfaE bifunctional protein nucleotidyltransferase chain/domain
MMEYLLRIEAKIRQGEQIARDIAVWKFKGEKIVFTNGCFDVLHKGHFVYLAQAASLGTKLVIGLNSDASTRRLKGEGRPVNGERDRALALASLLFVDAVVLFDEDTPIDLIRRVQPDILVKGGDYRIEEIVGHDLVKASGGEVLTIPFVDGYSTTSLLNLLERSK